MLFLQIKLAQALALLLAVPRVHVASHHLR
jgi:hypothetical protein